MKKQHVFIFSLTLSFSVATTAFGEGNGAAGGTTLLQPTSARASSLGEAFSAVKDDLNGTGYNPASLRSLKKGQVSFQYNRGISDDAFGHFAIGTPTQYGAVSFSLGHLDAGTFELFDGQNARTVTLKSDTIVSLGYARKIAGVRTGLTTKYLRSELGETYSASAFAVDLGLQADLGSRLSLGVAAQNIGTKLRYQTESDDLPRLVRGGASYLLKSGKTSASLLLDASYLTVEKQFRPSVGLETLLGPLALRAGYQGGQDNTEFSIGTGFFYRNSSLDYSFGMVEDFNSRHRVSYSFRFGGPALKPTFVTPRAPLRFPKERLAKKPKKIKKKKIEEPKDESGPIIGGVSILEKTLARKKAEAEKAAADPNTPKPFINAQEKFKDGTTRIKRLQPKYRKGRKLIRRTYVVQKNDTLKSIAYKVYGKSRYWEAIYDWNEKTINDFNNVDITGKTLKLPPVAYVTRPLVYTIKKGDTLKSIARYFYGKPGMWKKLYDMNENVINDFSKGDALTGKKIRLP